MRDYINNATLLALLEKRNVAQGINGLKDLPKPESMLNMQNGAKLIASSIRANEDILVVGDYDCDGVCASVIMRQFFDMLGFQHARVIIPNRFIDGYGVSEALLSKVANGAKLVISVDNGITAFSAAAWCKANGAKLVITDHHTPLDTLPEADVIIDPQLDSSFLQQNICGAAVAWYVCAAIKQELNADISLSHFLPYLAIATIADIMPLNAINRIFVKKGIEMLINSQSALAQSLKQHLKHINAENIAFYLAPLINAAGRIDSADRAFEFLIADDVSSALSALNALKALNNKRKNLQNDILANALDSANMLESRHFVICYGNEWHEGVLGIVAAQVARQKQKSAFVLSGEAVLKGSGRSFDNGANNVNLIKTITPLSALLTHFGGHSGAVGISIEREKLGAFLEALESSIVLEESVSECALYIKAKDINNALLATISAFEPYGCGNPKPIFICENMEVRAIKPLGAKQNHFKYTLFELDSGISLQAIAFNAKAPFKIDERINATFELVKDDYNNSVLLKLLEST